MSVILLPVSDDMALGDSNKVAWYRHWITLAFSAIEVHLDASERINEERIAMMAELNANLNKPCARGERTR